MSLKVFVTGATGLIGAATVRSLVAAGHQVTGLTSRAQNIAAVERLGAKAIVGDMRAVDTYREVASAADAIIHAASSMPDKSRYNEADVLSMMVPDSEAIDALVSVRGPSCRVIIFTSGAYVYGETGLQPVSESTPTDHPHAVMKLKVVTEQRLLALAKAGTAPVLITRPGLIYGDSSLWAKLYVNAMLKGSRAMMPGNGKNIISFISVDDVGEAYRLLVERGVPGEIYNLADDQPAPLGDVVRAQAKALGAPAPMAVPGWVIKLVAGPLSGAPALANNVLSNQKIKALGLTLKYPRYQEGVVALAKQLRG